MSLPEPSMSSDALEPTRPSALTAVYTPDAAGMVLLYTGPLIVVVDDEGTEEAVDGAITLSLHPRTRLELHIPKNDSSLFAIGERGPDVQLRLCERPVPPDEDCRPPLDEYDQILINHIKSGSTIDADRFLFHINGPLRGHLNLERTEQGRQQQHAWTLQGWDLRLARIEQGELGFNHMIEATPTSPVAEGAVQALQRTLFLLLSFIAGREIGIGPTCGLRGAEVVYVKWGAPRVRYEQPGLRWCSSHLFAPALDAISDGYTNLEGEPGLQAVVNRSIQFYLSAGSSEVLDVRVPVACAGLELMAWGVLLHRTEMKKAQLRIPKWRLITKLLEWAQVPTDIPGHFAALRSRSVSLDVDQRSGPGTLFKIRNALMHPPLNVNDPEWPSGGELTEAWQLSTWYLELVILRVFGYQGDVQSRLVLRQWEGTVGPVPWATGPPAVGADSA